MKQHDCRKYLCLVAAVLAVSPGAASADWIRDFSGEATYDDIEELEAQVGRLRNEIRPLSPFRTKDRGRAANVDLTERDLNNCGTRRG